MTTTMTIMLLETLLERTMLSIRMILLRWAKEGWIVPDQGWSTWLLERIFDDIYNKNKLESVKYWCQPASQQGRRNQYSCIFGSWNLPNQQYIRAFSQSGDQLHAQRRIWRRCAISLRPWGCNRKFHYRLVRSATKTILNDVNSIGKRRIFDELYGMAKYVFSRFTLDSKQNRPLVLMFVQRRDREFLQNRLNAPCNRFRCWTIRRAIGYHGQQQWVQGWVRWIDTLKPLVRENMVPKLAKNNVSLHSLQDNRRGGAWERSKANNIKSNTDKRKGRTVYIG